MGENRNKELEMAKWVLRRCEGCTGECFLCDVRTEILNYFRRIVYVNAKVSKVVSHLPPRHFDDTWAVALIKYIYPTAEIEWVHPQDEEKLKEYREREDVVLIDIGGEYAPRKFNFDHHQDITLPCSLFLCFRAFRELLVGSYLIDDDFNLSDYKWMRFLDYVDRKGFPVASKEYDVKPNQEIAKLQKIILFSAEDENFYKGKKRGDDYVEPFEILIEVLKEGKEGETFDDFIRRLYEKLDSYGFLEKGKRRVEEEEKQFRRKAEKAKVFEVKRGDEVIRVAVSSESFAPFHAKLFAEKKIDLLIEKNSMNENHTSIIKNTSSETGKEINLSELFKDIERVFVHKAGFLEVLNVKIDDLGNEKKIEEEVAKLLGGNKETKKKGFRMRM